MTGAKNPGEKGGAKVEYKPEEKYVFPEEISSLLQQMLDEFKLLHGLLAPPDPEGKYYNTPQTQIIADTPTQPGNPDTFAVQTTNTPGYQREQIYVTLHRKAPKITLINDGTSTLYVISSSDGANWTSEAPILVGEARTLYDVWELRIRSPNRYVTATGQGGLYRVTEYDYWLAYSNAVVTTTSLNKELAVVHNQALPAINTDFLATALSPLNTPTTFRVQVAISIAGNFSAAITRGTPPNTQVVTFNAAAGPALVAGGLYIFDLLVHDGDTVNFRYSATGGTIQLLRVQEIDSAS